MHLRVRSFSSDPCTSFQKFYEVQLDNTEVENTLAEWFWNLPQEENRLNSTAHLQIITQRSSEPSLVLEFEETGCNFVFQVYKGVAQWCIEIIDVDKLPDGCTLVKHEFVSNKLMPVTGRTFCCLINLLDLDGFGMRLPSWITRTLECPTSRIINIALNTASGSIGHLSIIARHDARVTEVFHALRRWPNFNLRQLGSQNLLLAEDQPLYSFDLVKTQVTLVRDLGLLPGSTWLIPERISTKSTPQKASTHEVDLRPLHILAE